VGGAPTGGIVGIGVVIGAVLTPGLGGGVVTLAPGREPEDEGGTLPDIADTGLQLLLMASIAYPSGHVTVGATVVVGVVKPSQLGREQRRYAITSRRATEQLTYL
jgi:hypothetical protein